MTESAVAEAKHEAMRFLARLCEYEISDKSFRHCTERAAMVRASLDLTKALARMRRGE